MWYLPTYIPKYRVKQQLQSIEIVHKTLGQPQTYIHVIISWTKRTQRRRRIIPPARPGKKPLPKKTVRIRHEL